MSIQVGFEGPDPQFKQFLVFQEAVKSIQEGCSVSYSTYMQYVSKISKTLGTHDDLGDELKDVFKDCLVWYDFFSTIWLHQFLYCNSNCQILYKTNFVILL